MDEVCALVSEAVCHQIRLSQHNCVLIVSFGHNYLHYPVHAQQVIQRFLMCKSHFSYHMDFFSFETRAIGFIAEIKCKNDRPRDDGTLRSV